MLQQPLVLVGIVQGVLLLFLVRLIAMQHLHKFWHLLLLQLWLQRRLLHLVRLRVLRV